jgi:proton-dependent oligopeptide transporter, POT family
LRQNLFARADADLRKGGRYKTISVAIVIAIVGHVVIVVSAVPAVIVHSDASMGVFVVGLIIFGIGTGFFKTNISPLVAEQYEVLYPRPVIFVEKSGERVIFDPNLTISRIYMRYYFFVNVGALVGQIAMVRTTSPVYRGCCQDC